MRKQIQIGLVNDTASEVCVALTKGTFPTLEELKKNYPFITALAGTGNFFTTGEGATAKHCSLTLPGSDKTIEHFQTYFERTMGVVVSIEMTSSVRENLNGEIKYGLSMPFDSPSIERVRLAPFVSVNQNDNTRLVADLVEEKKVLPLTPHSFLAMTIAPNSSMQLIMEVEVKI